MKKTATFTAMGLAAILGSSAMAQPDLSDVEIVPHQLSDNIYYLQGQGGNIGVSVGDDGIFLIDDQFAPLSEKILDALEDLSDEPLRFVLNTHHHGDHTGGNANMAAEGAVIIAHENVRRILRDGFTGGDLSQALTEEQSQGLPFVTFTDTVNFHLNGDFIHVFHIGPGHTGGDSFVYFYEDNIIHTGDVFRTTTYPRVDAGSGGTFQGIVESYEQLLEVSNADTRFLPGHGVVSSQADVREQLMMFYTIRNRVQDAINRGMSLDQIMSANLTSEFDDRWGDPAGVLPVIYNELIQ